VLAACHVHSSWSYDGSWSLESLAATFAERGCRLLLMTEHDRGFTSERFAEYRKACADASSGAILVVPGLEYSDIDNRVHVLVWGPVPFLGEGLRTDAVLDGVAEHGGAAVLAHPARKQAFECFRPAWAGRLVGIEVWNRKYDGWAPSDIGWTLVNGASVVPFAGLDFHTRRQLFPLGMALQIDGDLNEAAVVECLKERRCAARAFGVPLDADRFRRTVPVLQAAERGRRRLAALKRSAARFSRGASIL
jgi:hypothetical protein